MCFGLGCEYENSLTGECGYRGRGYFPCNDWGDDDEDGPEEYAQEAHGRAAECVESRRNSLPPSANETRQPAPHRKCGPGVIGAD